MALQLGLDVTHGGASTAVVVRGELDLASAVELADFLRVVLDTGTTDVVVDLGELSFIDSYGLEALVEARARFVERGGELVVRSPGRLARRLLDVLDLGRSLKVEPALAASRSA